MTLFGVDLSVYQAGINWDNVGAAGIEFAVARASIGLRVDATFPSHRAGAIGQGMLAGAYHYLEAGSGKAQADVFLAATNGAHGILAALDCEAQGLTIGIISDFADRFREKTSRHPLFIYTGISWWIAHGNPSLKGLGPLWLAYYPKGSGYPGDSSAVWDRIIGGVKPTIWQYGPRPIAGRPAVDGDAYRGTRTELETYIDASQSGPVTTGDPMIGAEGIVVGSSYVIDGIPPGTEYFDGPTGPKIGTTSGRYDYLGVWGPMLAIEVMSAAAYSDGKSRPTIVAIARGKGTVRAKTTDELRAQAAQYATCPPAVDCSAAVATATAAGKAVGFEDAIEQGTAALAALKPSK